MIDQFDLSFAKFYLLLELCVVCLLYVELSSKRRHITYFFLVQDILHHDIPP